MAMTNKRKHERIPMVAVATVQYEDMDKRRSVQAMISSISLGGVGLYADHSIEDDNDVSVTIRFIATEGIMETITIEGQVVYNRKIGDMNFMGIQFDDEISDRNHPSLHEYIERALKYSRFPLRKRPY